MILDTSELIFAERRRMTLMELIQSYPEEAGVAISVITLAELQHGVRRAKDFPTEQRRGRFLLDLLASMEIVPVTPAIALLSGTIDAELEMRGEVIAMPDLLIAATAMQRGDEVVTTNVRHFSRIPRLAVRASPHLR